MSATGRGVRIAVIDSGVHPGHPHIGRIAGGVSLDAGGAIIAGAETTLDRLGHGTAVMAAIQEKAPDAEYFAVRVFHDTLRTTATALIAAIHWCARQRIDLINLSLGSTNPAHVPAVTQAVAHATAAGARLIAAREAEGAPCWPGALPQVLGIGLDWDCPRESCRLTDGVLHASGYPRPIPGMAQRRNLHGISFAVANITGLAACALEQARAEGTDEDIAEMLRRDASAARPMRAAQGDGSKSAGTSG